MESTSTSQRALELVADVAVARSVVRRNTYSCFLYSSHVRNFSSWAWNSRITSPCDNTNKPNSFDDALNINYDYKTVSLSLSVSQVTVLSSTECSGRTLSSASLVNRHYSTTLFFICDWPREHTSDDTNQSSLSLHFTSLLHDFYCTISIARYKQCT